MTDNYYYQRTDDYKPIQRMEKQGCYEVPMVHTAVLVNLRTRVSDQLTYNPDKIPNYDGPEDDIIAFAVNAKKNGNNNVESIHFILGECINSTVLVIIYVLVYRYNTTHLQ